VPVAALFREEVSREWHRPRWSYLALMAAVIALLVAVAIGLSYDKRVAAVFVVSSVAVFALLRVVAAGLMALARRMPRSRITMLRLAIANIYRPGALTPSVVMSLGLGLAVLVTITQIDGNLRRQFLAALPEKAPSFYFIDIPTADADRFGAFLKKVAPESTIEDVPMLRGRIVGARGVKADELKPSQDSEWVLQSDRGLTYTSEVPKGSKVVAGEWWSAAYSGPPLVSIEKKIADGLKVKIGQHLATLKHGVTRFRITLQCYEAQPNSRSAGADKLTSAGAARWVKIDALDEYALNTTGRKISQLLAKG
jgi:putative ABC transport system permease protein